MGIAEKKPDTLAAIQGGEADRYAREARLLLAGELPAGWQWLPSSRDTAVAVCSASEPAVYYKEFLPRGRFEKLKAVLRGSRGDRARQQAAVLQAAGLPTPEILCWGRGRENAFLIFRGFGGIGFFQYLKTHFIGTLKPEQIKAKRLLLQKAGALLGAMHHRGIVHGDLRQNNLLVKKEAGGYRFSLIDNESNRRWPFIPRGLVVQNLTQFAICAGLLSRTDLLRLFTAYTSRYPRFAGRSRRRLLRTVYLRSEARDLEIKVKGEIREHCRPFAQPNFRGEMVRGGVVDRQTARGVDPAEWFRQGSHTLKQDGNITVKLLSGAEGDALIAKRFTTKHFWYHLKVWLKQERAPGLWVMSHCFTALGVPVAAPLGYLLAGRGMWRTTSYFYCQYLASARDLIVVSREMRENFPAWLDRHHIIPRLARQLAVLHNHGFCHGDTKWANILARVETGQFWLIDLDGAGRVSGPLDRAICKDLARLLVDMIETGLPERLQEQFIREYCGLRRLPRQRVLSSINPQINKVLARHRKKIKGLSLLHETAYPHQ